MFGLRISRAHFAEIPTTKFPRQIFRSIAADSSFGFRHSGFAKGAHPFLRLHRVLNRLALSTRLIAQWRIVMRYRSATVADFHGIPRILKQAKEPQT
jgi:hypothetical protein